MKKCNICGVETQDTESSPTLDCGGDCLSCMAEAGDLDCIETMYRFLKEENRDLTYQRDELLAYAKCEEARTCGEDIAETVLKRHGFNPDECTAHEFMDRMRRAVIAKVEELK